jgi:predicted ABC-type ATPase
MRSAVDSLIEQIEPTITAQIELAAWEHELRGPDGRWVRGMDTLERYTSGGELHPGRAQLHDEIVAKALAGHEAHAHPVAEFLGGGPASGKSTLTRHGSSTPDSVQIDADEIKGQLPEYRQMISSRDPRAAMYVHEESSVLAKQIQAAAVGRRYNFTLDGTGDSAYAKMRAKVDAAKAAGYHTSGRYVTVDTDEAIRRAAKRAQRTGRMVPESVIREIHASVTGVFRQLIEDDVLDHAELWDNNGTKPVLVGLKQVGGQWAVRDEAAWQRFLAKDKA